MRRRTNDPRTRTRTPLVAVLLATALVAAGCFVPYDFTGSAGADLAFYDDTSGDWFVVGDATPFHDGDPTFVPVPGSYDGGAKWEAAEVDPGGSGWHTTGDAGTIPDHFAPPTLVEFASCAPNVVPVPADYDGDLSTEPAWFANGEWQIAGQAPFVMGNSPWLGGCAADHDVPVPADYDGDGDAEAAVYRPGTGRFWIDGEAGPRELPVHLGYPTAGDFDGDGTDEPALLRPDGTLHTETAVHQAASPTAPEPAMWPVVADYDGDGTDDPAAYDPGTGTGSWWIDDTVAATLTGSSQLPLTTPSWLLPHIIDLTWRLSCEQAPTSGCPTDATDGDLDGDGAADLTLTTWDGQQWAEPDGTPVADLSATGGDAPGGGDYDGDGTWDPASIDSTTGTWHTTSAGDLSFAPPACAAAPGDLPIGDLIPLVGDWDGDGRDEPGWFCRSDATWHRPGHAPAVLGAPADGSWQIDIPTPGDLDGDGDDEPAVYRTGDGSWLALGAPGPIAEWTGFGLPMAADYDGDGDDDPQLVDPWRGQWQATTGPWADGPGGPALPIPDAGEPYPAPADYDGDGAAERAMLTATYDGSLDDVWFDVEGGAPALVGSGTGTAGTSTAVLAHHLIWFTFAEQACAEADEVHCPRTFVDGDLDGDGLADPGWYAKADASAPATFHVAGDPTVLATAPGDTSPLAGDFDGDGRWEPAWVDLDTGTWTTTSREGTFTLVPPACAGTPLDGPTPMVGDFDHDTRDDPAWYCPSTGTWHFETGATLAFGTPAPVSPAWATGALYPDSYHDAPLVVRTASGDAPAVYSPVDGTIEVHATPWGPGATVAASPLALPAGGTDPGSWLLLGSQLERPGLGTWVYPDLAPDTWGEYPGPLDADGDGTAEAAAVGYVDGVPSYVIDGAAPLPLGVPIETESHFGAYPLTLSTSSVFAIIRTTYAEIACYQDGACPPGWTWPPQVPPYTP